MKKEKRYGIYDNSPYKENIDEVWNVLELFPKSCHKIFLKNLKTLLIKNISDKDLKKIAHDTSTVGIYIPERNTVYINKTNSKKPSIINHELFHTTSSNKKKIGISGYLKLEGKVRKIGDNLDEGITEYLTLKSINKKRSNTDYQVEVFVIECLTDIYNLSILIPYFKNNPSKFYIQFKKYHEIVIKLDLLLNKLSNYINITDIFEEYILLKEIIPEILKENKLYLENEAEISYFQKWLSYHQEDINKLYRKAEQENELLSNLRKTNTPYEVKESLELYNNWYKTQETILNNIIKRIIILGRVNNLSDNKIKKILIKNLESKKDYLDYINYHNKKLIRKLV